MLTAGIDIGSITTKVAVLDGIILFANQSCRPQSTGLLDLRDALVARTGIPVVLVHTDHCDPRAYAEGAINTRIEGFIEMMEARQRRAAA